MKFTTAEIRTLEVAIVNYATLWAESLDHSNAYVGGNIKEAQSLIERIKTEGKR